MILEHFLPTLRVSKLVIADYYKADTLSIAVQIRSGGKWCFWHPIRVTQPKFEPQPHLLIQWDISSESVRADFFLLFLFMSS